MGAQRRQRGKPQHTGPHLRFSGCAGRRSVRFSLLPFCQTASAFRLICLFHTFFRRGVYRAMVFVPLRCPKLFRFPSACLWAALSNCFAHLFIRKAQAFLPALFMKLFSYFGAMPVRMTGTCLTFLPTVRRSSAKTISGVRSK